MLSVQVEASDPHQEDQALRVGRREEEEGTDDPVLNPLHLLLSCPPGVLEMQGDEVNPSPADLYLGSSCCIIYSVGEGCFTFRF